MPGEWETPQQGECPTTPWLSTPPSLTPRLQTRNHGAPRMANERQQHQCHVQVLPDQRMRVSAHVTICMVTWALGNGKLPHDLVDVKTAHPQHRSTSPNDTNEEPRTQVNERGSAPMPRTWHGRWGIGHTPNRECAHIPIAVFSLTPCLQTRNHSTPRTANERWQHPCPPMPHMWHR